MSIYWRTSPSLVIIREMDGFVWCSSPPSPHILNEKWLRERFIPIDKEYPVTPSKIHFSVIYPVRYKAIEAFNNPPPDAVKWGEQLDAGWKRHEDYHNQQKVKET